MPAATIAAILMLDSQIEVFGFGAAGPDARRFPRMILWLLAGVLTLRQILGLRAGGLPGLGRVLAIAAVTAAVLSAMPHLSFLVGFPNHQMNYPHQNSTILDHSHKPLQKTLTQ